MVFSVQVREVVNVYWLCLVIGCAADAVQLLCPSLASTNSDQPLLAAVHCCTLAASCSTHTHHQCCKQSTQPMTTYHHPMLHLAASCSTHTYPPNHHQSSKQSTQPMTAHHLSNATLTRTCNSRPSLMPITPSNWSEVVLSFHNYSFTSRLLYYQILILKVKAKVAILFLSCHCLK